jgi:chitin disaccharide deacetylase
MIICADDYGMRPDIDRAILQLCDSSKLSAVSCMVLFERCNGTLMEKIRAHESRVDIGLHFCLTNEKLPQSGPLEKTRLPKLKTLFLRAMLRQLPHEEIFQLLATQYELFINKAGRKPDYIDGHLHAHQLPVVADALVEFVRQLPVEQRPYIRNTCLPADELHRQNLPWLKAGFVSALGAPLKKKLCDAGIATNEGFAGIYNFKNWRNYAEYFPRFAACLPGPNGILVTHPGFDEDWRRGEFETLKKFSGGSNRFFHGTATSAMPFP